MRISDWSSDVCSSDLKGPGEHGVFEFIRAEDRGDEVYWTLYDARDVDTETIWSIASRKKKTIAALNFPLTAPAPEGINGKFSAAIVFFLDRKSTRLNSSH